MFQFDKMLIRQFTFYLENFKFPKPETLFNTKDINKKITTIPYIQSRSMGFVNKELT